MMLATFSGNGHMVANRLPECNSESLVYRTVATDYHSCMNLDVKQIRRANLDQMIKEAGSVPELSKKSGASEKYLRQILNGFQGARDKTPRQVGDALARSLEEGMGKPYGWMDVDHTAADKPSMGDVLGVPIFPLVCPECGQVSHKSFIQLEMNDRLPCDACGVTFNINHQYGHGELKMFLEALGYSGFVLRQQRKFD